jgi:hypothetical protein
MDSDGGDWLRNPTPAVGRGPAPVPVGQEIRRPMKN